MIERRLAHRRNATKDELDACKADVELRISGHDARLQAIEANTKATLDIVSAWNNAQGFVKTVKAISTVIKVLTLPVAAAGALWYFFSTGHWPKG